MLMSTRLRGHITATRCILVCVIRIAWTGAATLTAVPPVPTMPTVADEMHRNEGDEDHDPEPVRRKPCHVSLSCVVDAFSIAPLPEATLNGA